MKLRPSLRLGQNRPPPQTQQRERLDVAHHRHALSSPFSDLLEEVDVIATPDIVCRPKTLRSPRLCGVLCAGCRKQTKPIPCFQAVTIPCASGMQQATSRIGYVPHSRCGSNSPGGRLHSTARSRAASGCCLSTGPCGWLSPSTISASMLK